MKIFLKILHVSVFLCKFQNCLESLYNFIILENFSDFIYKINFTEVLKESKFFFRISKYSKISKFFHSVISEKVEDFFRNLHKSKMLVC